MQLNQPTLSHQILPCLPGFYEPIVKKHYDNILSVSAIVLANLCVSYIMTSQNEEAEELMRKIEKEEEQVAYDDPDKKVGGKVSID